MCGIGGVIGADALSVDVLIRTSGLMRHRGPDDEGYYLSLDRKHYQSCAGRDTHPDLAGLGRIEGEGAFTVGLVHRRLSIQDTSSAGHQPFISDDARYAIVYNGELYNVDEIRDDLIEQGFTFHSSGDTEVVLQAFRHWGQSCFARFVGMWALAIWDSKSQTLLLSRDRFGIKPLFYCDQGGKFAFASEVKPLLTLAGARPMMNDSVASHFLTYGLMPEQDMIFDGVHQVEPGTNILFTAKNRTVVATRYYDLRGAVEARGQDPISFQEYASTLAAAVNSHMIADDDVVVGSCLSGGLDSSAIVSIMADDPARISTVTAVFPEQPVDESGFAQAVAGNFSQVCFNATTPTADGLLQDLDSLVRFQEVPFRSTSMYAQWCVMKKAQEIGIKVLMDGQGADETLGGYSYFLGINLLEQLRKFRLSYFARELRSFGNRQGIDSRRELLRGMYYSLPNSLRHELGHRFRTSAGFSRLDGREYGTPDSGGSTLREASLSAVQYGLSDLLRYEDRNSMAFSIESRVPFLDHRLVETSIAMASYNKIVNGWQKYPLRLAIERRLPQSVVWRRDKKGFVTPQGTWFNALRTEFRQFVNESEVPDFFVRSKLLELQEAESLGGSQQTEYWRALLFLKWYQVMIRSEW